MRDDALDVKRRSTECNRRSWKNNGRGIQKFRRSKLKMPK